MTTTARTGTKCLHLGCGEVIGAHWENVDSSPNVLLDNHPLLRATLAAFLPASSRKRKFTGAAYLDLRSKWPYQNATFDAVYSSHVFEHFSIDDGLHVLRESHRVLKPGGRIRFLLPTVEHEVARYLALKETREPLAATRFAQALHIFSSPPPGPHWYRLFFRLYDKNIHKMLYDAESLQHYFADSGFVKVRCAQFLDSSVPYIDEVELENRFEGAVCVEAERRW